jgi:UDP-N-acetylglucosamine/UDP-N-acetyl-alpha-D-glucosaminouronate 4-epimerase
VGIDLITGGSGFIGSHIAEALLAQGRRVRVVDNLSTGKRQNLDGLDLEFVTGDLSEAAIATAACAGVEHVYHLAARPSVPWSLQHPEAAYQANHGTTLQLIEAATRAGVKRIVFSSSSAIYGDNPTLPKREAMLPEPKSPYAEHKLLGERALKAAHEQAAFEAVSLRYFNVYGPRQDPSSPYSGVISLFAQWAQKGQQAQIFGDGLQTRDFVFVSDVVQANLAAMQAVLPETGPVINIATETAISILDLWAAVCDAAEIPFREVELLPDRPGDVRHSLANLDRARSILDFEPQVDFIQGLRQALQG